MKTKKTSYQNDFEGAYLNVNMLTKDGAEVTDAHLISYQSMAKQIATKTYTFNIRLFQQIGMESSDIESIAMCYVYTFLRHYHYEAGSLTERRILYHYIQQKMERLVTLAHRKARGIIETSEYDDTQIESDVRLQDDGTPEDICIAKDTAAETLKRLGRFFKAELQLVQRRYTTHKSVLNKINIDDKRFSSIIKGWTLEYISRHPELQSKTAPRRQFRHFIEHQTGFLVTAINQNDQAKISFLTKSQTDQSIIDELLGN